MQVQSIKISEVKPYDKNPRKNDDGVEAVANSIKEFGWQQPIVVDKDNVIIVGHTRYKAAKKLGMKEVPVVVADKLSPEQVKAYRLADNKTGELTDWDMGLLDDELADIADIDMSDFGFDILDQNVSVEDKRKFDDAYSQKVDSIDYEPTGKSPDIDELIDTTKYSEIVKEINHAKLPEDVKRFLLLSASRFIKFNFAKIAEFYVHSKKEIQRQFEKQLLVIVDYNDALEQGIAEFKDSVRDAEISQMGDCDDRLK